METRGVVVSRDGPEELTLYITCQSPHLVARWLSLSLGLPETAIRVIAKDVGGGFGLKNHPWKEELSVIVAALKFGRPLKWIEDRYENLVGANQAREQEMTLQVAFDNDEKFHAAMEKWTQDMEAVHNKAELIIAKQRHGPTGMVKLFFEAEFTRFGDLDQVHSQADAY